MQQGYEEAMRASIEGYQVQMRRLYDEHVSAVLDFGELLVQELGPQMGDGLILSPLELLHC